RIARIERIQSDCAPDAERQKDASAPERGVPRDDPDRRREDTAAVEVRDDGRGYRIVGEHDQKIESEDPDDANGLEEPRLAVERVAEKAPGTERRHARDCDHDPGRRGGDGQDAVRDEATALA